MKPFRFSLEAVLTLRTRAEREALEAYAHALNELRQLERLSDTLQRELAELVDGIREKMRSGCPAARLLRLRHYERYLQHRYNNSLQALREGKTTAQRALQKVLAARRGREAVDQLRSKHLERHRRKVERLNQRIIDELASQNAAPVLSWQSSAETIP